ncbi:hypothetical protein WHR41_09434 [Cladosporium halotolerans]|uniref:cAMP-independent regulatory protein pac2 n=1 Tax=Cladosporium halotolerans TaxID=1052096 RepID=A0AB34K9V3_9PEZI
METYNGHVRTPADAIILFEACHIGLLPRVQRRLSERERQLIKSGSVFVWEESEAGIRRWTDGRSWSASRVSGSFLTYREMEGKRGVSTFENSAPCESMQNGAEQESDGGFDGYRYKPDGLVKQSFSITTNDGRHMHLISYYSQPSQAGQRPVQPTNDPQLHHVWTEKGIYSGSTIHGQSTVPAVIGGPMGWPGYIHAAHQRSIYGCSSYDYAPPHPSAWSPPGPMRKPPPHPHYGPYYHHPAFGHPMQHPPQPAKGLNSCERPQPHAICSVLPLPPHYDRGPPSPPPVGGLLRDYPSRYHGRGSYQSPPISTPSFPSASTAAPPPSLTARPAPPPVKRLERKEDDRHDSTETQLKSQARPTPETTSQHSTAATASTPSTTNSTASSARAGQNIPSINLMLKAGVNGQPTVRSSSCSPSGSGRMASDIPMHKLGFEADRDMQALRNLDKSTFKAY